MLPDHPYAVRHSPDPRDKGRTPSAIYRDVLRCCAPAVDIHASLPPVMPRLRPDEVTTSHVRRS